MRSTLLTIVLLAWVAAPAQAAPWRLAGISENQRALKLTYKAHDCRPGAVDVSVDTSRAGRVRIALRRDGGEDARRFCPLVVRLGERLDRREVVGGPLLRGVPPMRRVPRVIGLLEQDAREALGRQRLIFTGTRTGVVRDQFPGPGEAATGRVRLALARVGGDARLRIAIAPGQTPRSVLAGGLRFRYRVNPAAEARLAGTLLCDQTFAGSLERPVRAAVGSGRVRIAPGQRHLLRARRVPCSLVVLSYAPDAADMTDYLRSRRDTVVLRR